MRKFGLFLIIVGLIVCRAAWSGYTPNPMTTLGDIIYENSTQPARLPGSISTTPMYLQQTGTSSVSAAPVWTSFGVFSAGTITGADSITGAIFGGSGSTIAGSSEIGGSTLSGNSISVGNTVSASTIIGSASSMSGSSSALYFVGNGSSLTGLSGSVANYTANTTTGTTITGGSTGSILVGGTTITGAGAISTAGALNAAGGTMTGGTSITGILWTSGNILSADTISGAALYSAGGGTLTGASEVGGSTLNGGNINTANTITGGALSIGGGSTLTGAASLTGGLANYLSGIEDAGADTVTRILVPEQQDTIYGTGEYLIETGNTNILANQNFLNSSSVSSGWTLEGSTSGGTTTGAANNATIYGNQPQSIKLTMTGATAAMLYQDMSPTGTFQGVNMGGSMTLNTSTSNLQVCSRQGGLQLVNTCNNVPATSTWQTVYVNQAGAASGGYGVGLYPASGKTVTGTAYVAKGYVGPAQNLSQVSQAQLLGSVSISGCNQAWTATTTTATLMAGATGCTATANGALSAPTSNRPGFTIPAAAAGVYTVTYNGLAASSGGGEAQFYLCNGSNSSCASSGAPSAWNSITATQNSFLNNSAITLGEGSLSWSWTQAAGATNLELDVYGTSSAVTTYLYGTGGPPNGTFTVFFSPSQSQLAVNSAAAPNFGAVSVVGGGSDFTSTSGSWTTVSSSSFATKTLYGGGLNPSTANNFGAKFASIPAGTYRVDVSAPMYITSATAIGTTGVCGFRLYDGTNQIGYGQGKSDGFSVTNSSYDSIDGFHGDITYASTQTNLEIDLQTILVSGTGTCNVDPSATNAVATITLTPLNNQQPAPLLVGSVTSSGAGQYHTEAALINLSGASCTITSQMGSWLSVTGASTGNCNLTFSAGEFSAQPWCWGTMSTPNGGYVTVTPTSSTAGAMTQAASSTSVGVNGSSQIFCMGPH